MASPPNLQPVVLTPGDLKSSTYALDQGTGWDVIQHQGAGGLNVEDIGSPDTGVVYLHLNLSREGNPILLYPGDTFSFKERLRDVVLEYPHAEGKASILLARGVFMQKAGALNGLGDNGHMVIGGAGFGGQKLLHSGEHTNPADGATIVDLSFRPSALLMATRAFAAGAGPLDAAEKNTPEVTLPRMLYIAVRKNIAGAGAPTLGVYSVYDTEGPIHVPVPVPNGGGNPVTIPITTPKWFAFAVVSDRIVIKAWASSDVILNMWVIGVYGPAGGPLGEDGL